MQILEELNWPEGQLDAQLLSVCKMKLLEQERQVVAEEQERQLLLQRVQVPFEEK